VSSGGVRYSFEGVAGVCVVSTFFIFRLVVREGVVIVGTQGVCREAAMYQKEVCIDG
jgi:hypothetical protein